MTEQNDKNAKSMQETQIEELKEFIKPNPTAIFDLASISGLTPEQVEKAINQGEKKEEVPPVMIEFLHFAMQDMLAEKAAEIVMRNNMM